MQRRTLGYVLCLSALAQGMGAAGEDPTTQNTRTHEIRAECWFNAQPVRLFDPPRLVLLEFWSVRSRESRRFASSLDKLHQFFKDKGLLVVGLSSDECRYTENLLRHEKITYKMGGESDSAKKYGVEQFPTVVLIDVAKQKVVERWAGKEVSVEAVAKAVRNILGPPRGTSPGGLTHEGASVMHAIAADAGANIADITENILATEGEIGAESLEPLERFYQANMLDDPTREDAEARGARIARMSILGLDGDVGYAKLLSTGRLSEAGKAAVRDRVLEMAANDPNPGVRVMAIGALRKNLGQPGDPVLLDALRRMRASETDSILQAGLDHAIRELDPATREKTLSHNTRTLARELMRSPDPMATPWAEAYAYIQSKTQRSVPELLQDYETFVDPSDDEIGRQNATLKRTVAIDEILTRVERGEVQDLRDLENNVGRSLPREPDEWVRLRQIGLLNVIAERGGRALRAEVMELFKKELSTDTSGYDRAAMEVYLEDLKQK